MTSADDVRHLVDEPSESLTVELKGWILPGEDDGKAKIAKAVMSLFNYNGGHLVIGVNNDSLRADVENAPSEADARAQFHPDKIQQIVSQYSSQPIEVEVVFVHKEGKVFPVIVVPPGVRTPAAAKNDLRKNGGAEWLIHKNQVYVRTLTSNRTVSTSGAPWQDLERLIEICMDNRETDIGRFLRRQLVGVDFSQLGALFSSVAPKPPPKTPEKRAEVFLARGKLRYEREILKRNLTLPEFGTWEVAAIVEPPVADYAADSEFLFRLEGCQPHVTGWPPWAISSSFYDESTRPYYTDEGWEALIVLLNDSHREHLDFWRIEPPGAFYLFQALEDDLGSSFARQPSPRTAIDFGLPVWRVGESLIVAMEYARALGCPEETTTISFAFRWTGLDNRRLISWADPRRTLHSPHRSHEDSVTSTATIQIDTPRTSLFETVHALVSKLYRVFGGAKIDKGTVEEIMREMLQHRG